MLDTSRPWWRHPALGWAAGLVALRLAGILLFRSRRPAVLDAVRQANKRVLNPLMLHLAGHRHWYAARLEHVGRHSGRQYATPVVAQPSDGGLAIPLPYGTEVDWLRNLQAAGRGILQVDGVRYSITDPRIVPLDDLTGLPATWRALSRLYGIRQWLQVTTPVAAGASADDPVPAARRAAAGS
jgi:deazaflavin-dependent oxidoreductase (nitroreductase family)